MNDAAYRAGSDADVPYAAALFAETLADLCARNGIAPPSVTATDMEPVYRHLLRTGIFEIAERDGRMVAFASGFVRSNRFFLSMFWTHPSAQRRGIGQPLLERVHREAHQRGARTYAVWSSIDFAALGSYLRRGMRPLGPIFTFGGTPRAELVNEIDLELASFDATVVDRVDGESLGIERAIDHAFFAKEKDVAHLVRRGDEVVGHFYAHRGRVGPAAWLEQRHGRALLALALSTAGTRGPVTMSVLGTCHASLDAALDAGLQIQTTAHFLATSPFPTLDRYVPSGPALF